jgi:hypothetical protein
VDAGSQVHRAPEALQTCGSSPAAVGSIAQTLARFNGLPPPVSGPCFIASLQRPLNVVATKGTLSLQPAEGAENPRIFILAPQVVLSFVPAGDAGQLLEMGEWDTTTRTLKGEIALPVTSTLAPDAPFTRILSGSSATTCAICHRAESPSASQVGGYVSSAFRPQPSDLVPVSALAAQHNLCVDAGTVSERCDYFHAFFDFGEVKQGAFASSVELFIP